MQVATIMSTEVIRKSTIQFYFMGRKLGPNPLFAKTLKCHFWGLLRKNLQYSRVAYVVCSGQPLTPFQGAKAFLPSRCCCSLHSLLSSWLYREVLKCTSLLLLLLLLSSSLLLLL